MSANERSCMEGENDLQEPHYLWKRATERRQ